MQEGQRVRWRGTSLESFWHYYRACHMRLATVGEYGSRLASARPLQDHVLCNGGCLSLAWKHGRRRQGLGAHGDAFEPEVFDLFLACGNNSHQRLVREGREHESKFDFVQSNDERPIDGRGRVVNLREPPQAQAQPPPRRAQSEAEQQKGVAHRDC
eukprot:4323740-Amphidinium_carterae.1